MKDFGDTIARAEREGRRWAVLVDEDDAESGRLRRIEMHLPTGVAVLAEATPGDDGRLRYATASYFLNRRTGRELACGSRRWNEGVHASREQLEQAVQAAREDVPRRFPGMIRIYERRRGHRAGASGA